MALIKEETMTTEKPIPVVLPSAAANQIPAPVLEEPTAGGNYVRDPVTGALSLNPDHLPQTSPLE